MTADYPDAHGAHGVKLESHEVATEGHEFVPHESPPVMLIPLIVLSLGALFAGMALAPYFIGDHQAAFWKDSLFYGPNNHILEAMEHVPFAVKQLPLLMLVLGFGLAWFGYIYDLKAPARWVATNPIVYALLSHKWYFDEIYDFIFVKPAFALGRIFWIKGDQQVIDRFGPHGAAELTLLASRQAVKIQSGYVYHYAFAMLIGISIFVTWFVVGGVH